LPGPGNSACGSGMSMVDVFIGFGSNQGDSMRICRGALEEIGRHPLVRVTRVSSFYRTKPVGPVRQDWFVNGVVRCGTSLSPEELYALTSGIERVFGRRREVPWGPRTLDLDILSYGEVSVDLSWLKIPHPRLHERLFVLVPLVEIASDWVHPERKVSAKQLLDALRDEDHDQQVEPMEAP